MLTPTSQSQGNYFDKLHCDKSQPIFCIQLLCSVDITNKFTLTNIQARDPKFDKQIGLS